MNDGTTHTNSVDFSRPIARAQVNVVDTANNNNNE